MPTMRKPTLKKTLLNRMNDAYKERKPICTYDHKAVYYVERRTRIVRGRSDLRSDTQIKHRARETKVDSWWWHVAKAITK